MTDEPNRCEPPAHLRGKSGWYWLAYNGKPYHEPIWWEADPDHWENRSGTWRGIVGGRPDWARDNGWRYLAPVPSPEAVARLVEAAERARDDLHNYAHGDQGACHQMIQVIEAALTPFKEPTT